MLCIALPKRYCSHAISCKTRSVHDCKSIDYEQSFFFFSYSPSRAKRKKTGRAKVGGNKKKRTARSLLKVHSYVKVVLLIPSIVL